MKELFLNNWPKSNLKTLMLTLKKIENLADASFHHSHARFKRRRLTRPVMMCFAKERVYKLERLTHVWLKKRHTLER